MRKLVLLVLGFAILPSLILLGCKSESQEDMERKLQSSIEKKRGSAEEVIVRLPSLTAFEWDKFYVFEPYTPKERLQRLGFDSSTTDRIGLDMRDDINLLVFIRNGKVVCYLEYKRGYGDFSKLSKPDGFTPDETVFVVKEEDHGTSWLVLYELAPPNGKK